MNIERFTGKADSYHKYRPSYPQEIITLLQNKFGLSKNSVVADIGAGTGIFSKFVAPYCESVYAVEPNEDMRGYIDSNTNIKIISGTSENTNLNDNSIDIITVAQAFHWFDKEPTKTEFARILKQEGYVVLVWNERNKNTPFEKSYEAISDRYRFDALREKRYNSKEAGFFFRNGEFSKYCFDNEQTFDLSHAVGRVSSSSYFPREDTVEFAKAKTEIEDLFNQYSVNGKITITMQTEVYIGKV